MVVAFIQRLGWYAIDIKWGWGANVLLSGYYQGFYVRAICTANNIRIRFMWNCKLCYFHTCECDDVRDAENGEICILQHVPESLFAADWLTAWWDIQDIHAHVYSIQRRFARWRRQGQRQQRREKINKCGKMKMSFLNSLCVTYLYSSQRAPDLMAL